MTDIPTDRFFRSVKGEFCRRCRVFAGKPITYVEIGCWRGASSRWVCQHILTHRKSKGFGIDPYLEVRSGFNRIKYRQRYMDRLYRRVLRDFRLNHRRCWKFIRQTSVEALSGWTNGPIDLLYIDGLHQAPNVMLDFCLAWPHLSVGAGVILDDYEIGKRKSWPHVPEAVEAIQSVFDGLVEPWGRHRRQAGFRVVKKTPDFEWLRERMAECET